MNMQETVVRQERVERHVMFDLAGRQGWTGVALSNIRDLIKGNGLTLCEPRGRAVPHL